MKKKIYPKPVCKCGKPALCELKWSCEDAEGGQKDEGPFCKDCFEASLAKFGQKLAPVVKKFIR